MTRPKLCNSKFQVLNRTLPPWDRAPTGRVTNLKNRLGQQIAAGPVVAADILGVTVKQVRKFVGTGILRDARFIERPCEKLTYACVTASYPTRFYLEYGEKLKAVELGQPEAWVHDADESDYEGRTCIRIRPKADGAIDDLQIITDRRTYRVRLVWNPLKVTIGCTWSYPNPITRNEGGRILNPPAALRLIKVRAQASLTRYVMFRLGPNLAMQVMRWAAGLESVKTKDLQSYKAMHRQANVPASWKHPSTIMTAVAARALAVRGFSAGEVRQWMTLPRDFHPTIDLIKFLAKRALNARDLLPLGRAPSMGEMVDAFPHLAGLPETSLDDPEAFEAPNESLRKIVWTMGPLADYAAFFSTVAQLYIRRTMLVTATLQHLKTIERIAKDDRLSIQIDVATSVGALIDHIIASPTCGHLTATNRYAIARSLLLVIKLLRRYIRTHDRDGKRGLGHLRPVDPVEIADALSRLRAFGRDLGAEWRANRKQRVFRHTGKVTELEMAADLNLEQVVLTTRALKAAATELKGAPYIDVPVAMTIVDGQGRLKIGSQQCIWRVWKAEAYLKRLLATSDCKSERACVQEQLDALIAGRVMAPINEYRRTVGVLGSTPIEPFAVRCWRHGLMMAPATLPRHVQRRRAAVIRELKLPAFDKTRTGLLQGTNDEMNLWRISLRQHRVLAFLDPFEHALRFAHLALSSVFENMSRSTAWAQQTQDQSGWEDRRLNKQKVWGFLAHDKIPSGVELPYKMSWFPVGPKHLEEAAELVSMTCDRCGYDDGRLPEIQHRDEVLWKRPDPQAWTFSFSGSVLNYAELARFLRFLLPGRGAVTYHDFRHLLANAAYAAGVPGWMIRLALNHSATELWLYYAQLSESQLADLEAESIHTRVARSADARSHQIAA